MATTKSIRTTPSMDTHPSADNPPIGTVTSSFFVQIGSENALVGSNLDDNDAPLSSSVQLLWFHSIEERVSVGNMTKDNQASSTLIHSLLEMHIQTDSWMPKLRQSMRSNSNIDQIRITRVGHLGEGMENKELYSTTFTNCKLESVEEYPDKLILKARVTTRSDVAAVTTFDADDNQPGNEASAWDYTKNVASTA